MLNVTVLFKNGGVLKFDAAELVYKTSTEEDTYGKLVGYEIKSAGTHTSVVYLNIENIDGILCESDEIVQEEENEQGG